MSTTTMRATTAPTTLAWARAGLIGGMIAGVVFAMFEMVMAAIINGGDAFFMPLRMIGAIGLGTTAMDPDTSLLVAGGVGLVIHMALSMMYGVGVAAVLAMAPTLSRSSASTIGIATVAGFALWIINFFLLAGVFGWTWFPDTQDVAVQLVAHTFMFGTVLGVALDRLAFRATR